MIEQVMNFWKKRLKSDKGCIINIKSIGNDVYFLYQDAGFRHIGILLFTKELIIFIDPPKNIFSRSESCFSYEIDELIKDKINAEPSLNLLFIFSHPHIDHSVPFYSEIFKRIQERYNSERERILIFPTPDEENYFTTYNSVAEFSSSFKSFFQKNCKICKLTEENGCITKKLDDGEKITLLDELMEYMLCFMNFMYSQGCNYLQFLDNFDKFRIKELNYGSTFPFKLDFYPAKAHHPHLHYITISIHSSPDNQLLRKIYYMSDSLPLTDVFLIPAVKIAGIPVEYDELVYFEQLKKDIAGDEVPVTIISSHPIRMGKRRKKFMFICENINNCLKIDECPHNGTFYCEHFKNDAKRTFLNILNNYRKEHGEIEKLIESYIDTHQSENSSLDIETFEIPDDDNIDFLGEEVSFRSICCDIVNDYYNLVHNKQDLFIENNKDRILRLFYKFKRFTKCFHFFRKNKM
ncbi:MAG: hypothetical protein ACFFCS_13195 [Candidatus Hodarchaeota archaeon]